MPVLHHATVGTDDLAHAIRFYDAVMKEVGLRRLKATERMLAYGLTATIFSVERPADGKPASVGNGSHIAFEAGNRAAVDAAARAAAANGGRCESPPAIHPGFDPNYYATFLRDPDGNKIEVVTFAAT